MSVLRLSTLKLPVCELGESEAVPAILSLLNIQQAQQSDLDDDDGLYVGYGFVKNNFPYFAQSMAPAVGHKIWDMLVVLSAPAPPSSGPSTLCRSRSLKSSWPPQCQPDPLTVFKNLSP